MWGKKASCWLLLKRCTSSTNNTVRRPRAAASRACSIDARISFTPAKTAESCKNSASLCAETSLARVVLPTPGGPHHRNECSPSRDSIAFLSGCPGPRRWRCPTTSSRHSGRILAAKGSCEVSSDENRSFSSIWVVASVKISRGDCEIDRAEVTSDVLGQGQLNDLSSSISERQSPTWRVWQMLYGHSRYRGAFIISG